MGETYRLPLGLSSETSPPHPIDPIRDLALMAQDIERADGEREGAKRSNLTVEQTLAIAKKMREIAKSLLKQ